MRKAWFADGRHVDIVVIGILDKEWLKQRADLAARLSTDTMVILGRTPWGVRTWPQVPAEELKSVASS